MHMKLRKLQEGSRCKNSHPKSIKTTNFDISIIHPSRLAACHREALLCLSRMTQSLKTHFNMYTETFKQQQGSPCKILIHNVVQRHILTDSKNGEQASIFDRV